jgi:hypothetical protein
MNERIQELAKQAKLNNSHYIAGQGFLVNDIGMEKFAELIVGECGVALSPMLRDMVSRGQAYNLIKEHFGVEE